MRSFIALCKLTKLLDNVLSEFFTVQAASGDKRSSARLLVLESISADFETFTQSLPACLHIAPSTNGVVPATGVRKFAVVCPRSKYWR